jgi:hypothetical protein
MSCVFLQLCNEEFTNLEEFRLFCRRADKLLPATLAEIDDYVSTLILPSLYQHSSIVCIHTLVVSSCMHF